MHAEPICTAPAGHVDVHAVAPITDSCPLEQAVQDVDPLTLVYIPALHGKHRLTPLVPAYVPATQLLHAVNAAVLLYDPGLQAIHPLPPEP